MNLRKFNNTELPNLTDLKSCNTKTSEMGYLCYKVQKALQIKIKFIQLYTRTMIYVHDVMQVQYIIFLQIIRNVFLAFQRSHDMTLVSE